MILNETLLPGPVAIEQVTGHRPNYSQFFRWTQNGLKTKSGHRVRLEFCKAGSKRLTSVEAVQRFFKKQTLDAANASAFHLTSLAAEANPDAVADALANEDL